MPNRFYSGTSGGYGSQLMGLSGVIGASRERKGKEQVVQAEQDEKARVANVKQEISAAVQSGDTAKVQQLLIENPEMSAGITKALEVKLPGGSADAYKNALRTTALDPSQAQQALAGMIEQFEKDGIDAQEQESINKLTAMVNSETPEKLQKDAETAYSLVSDKDEWKDYESRKSETADPYEGLSAGYETYLRANDMPSSPENYKKYQAQKAGGETAGVWSKKNQDGSVRTIKNVVPGSPQEKNLIAEKFVRGTQTVGAKKTATERRAEKLEKSLGGLEEQASQNPNKFYEDHNFRMNDDGTLYVDPVDLVPVRLKQFTNSLGKRGNMKAIKALGEQMDDAGELMELLELPSVKKDLNESSTEIVDQTIGKTKNSLNAWLRRRGVAVDSNTATAMARIQRMASEERKRFMGTAVTASEIQTALEWMPSSSDTFETMINKTRLVGKEATQEFKRWLELHENVSDMSPFYKAFGMERFEDTVGAQYEEEDMATGPNGEKMIFRNGNWENM